ncbi:MAG: glycerol-3-phosphate 1-O-acyltransferase PlsY [Clostridia bacterium]|nr:glycerol-3-phosphate 1-O-acyltransferase PlsY [Clostridia bacterium]
MLEYLANTYTNGIIRTVAAGSTISVPFLVAGIVLTALVAYMLGSFNFALILSKKMYDEDIREYGSKNAGTTNMMRTYGKKAALFTILGDIGKGIASVIVGSFLLGAAFGGGYVAGVFCVIGHVFPLFYGFKGGKGVATAAAVILVCDPLVFLVVLGVFILSVVLTRFVSLGSCLAAALFPFLTYYHLLATDNPLPGGAIAFQSAFVMAILVICKHHANLKRLANGTESKFSFKKSKPEKGNAGENGDCHSYTAKKKKKNQKFTAKKK